MRVVLVLLVILLSSLSYASFSTDDRFRTVNNNLVFEGYDYIYEKLYIYADGQWVERLCGGESLGSIWVDSCPFDLESDLQELGTGFYYLAGYACAWTGSEYDCNEDKYLLTSVDYVLPQICGDGVTSDDEFCDGETARCITANGFPGIKECNDVCTGYSSCRVIHQCGDGVSQWPELCDGNSQGCSQDGYMGTRTCNTKCSAYNDCVLNEFCGDGIKNGYEFCDDGPGGSCNEACTGYVDSNQRTACNDGIDNDNDGLTDWQYDLGCTGPEDDTEGGKNNQLEDGWTVYEPQDSTRIFYVSSSSGNDVYSGLTPKRAFATVEKALSMLEPGRPDWVLFKRGDTFWESLDTGSTSGSSQDAPLIFGSYGDSSERPEFILFNKSVHNSRRGMWQNVAYLGLYFHDTSKNPYHDDFNPNGGSESAAFYYTSTSPVENILFEDIKIQGFSRGITLIAPPARGSESQVEYKDIDVRRSVFVDIYDPIEEGYAPSGFSTLLYTGGVQGVRFTENYVDICGWHPNVANAQPAKQNDCIRANRARSTTPGYPMHIKGNIVARTGADALYAGAGVDLDDNLFIENNNMGIGISQYDGTFTDVHVTNNVWSEASDKYIDGYSSVASGGRAGMAFSFSKGATTVPADVRICNNIAAHFSGETRDISAVTINGVTNYNAWSGTGPFMLLHVSDNEVNNNIVYDWSDRQDRIIEGDYDHNHPVFNPGSVSNAEVSVQRYLQSIGLNPSLDELYQKMRDQSKYNWDERITADAINTYIRSGFDMSMC